MIRRELAKDPKLATESWDRFLPQFRKRHLKTSEKTAKKNAIAGGSGTGANSVAVGVNGENAESGGSTSKTKKPPAKKVYTPFPPAQLPRKVDLQLESGEYFLAAHEKEAREAERRKQKVMYMNLYIPSIIINPAIYSNRRRRLKDERSELRSLLHLRNAQNLASKRNGRGRIRAKGKMNQGVTSSVTSMAVKKPNGSIGRNGKHWSRRWIRRRLMARRTRRKRERRRIGLRRRA